MNKMLELTLVDRRDRVRTPADLDAISRGWHVWDSEDREWMHMTNGEWGRVVSGANFYLTAEELFRSGPVYSSKPKASKREAQAGAWTPPDTSWVTTESAEGTHQ